jgi:hypothetical protein
VRCGKPLEISLIKRRTHPHISGISPYLIFLHKVLSISSADISATAWQKKLLPQTIPFLSVF